MEGRRRAADPLGIGFVFVKPNPLGPSGGHAHARPTVAGRIDAHVAVSSKRASATVASPPGVSRACSRVGVTHAMPPWLGELEATGRGIGWTVEDVTDGDLASAVL
ncbi:hypothetical protein PAHAL_9G086000 [Panicum hallii]|uniref:Uncharacterized protein n=1 Tax=Panicum hallii TaxID=206008 RepID=A0A2T8I0N7_9POAL|nr:hypothetical protein PAHAL_9G086000 [Panicum hallii]